MSAASLRAANLICGWMEDAGLTTLAFFLFLLQTWFLNSLTYACTISRWIDRMGNLHGRFEGMDPSAGTLLIGSHLVIFLLHFHYSDF